MIGHTRRRRSASGTSRKLTAADVESSARLAKLLCKLSVGLCVVLVAIVAYVTSTEIERERNFVGPPPLDFQESCERRGGAYHRHHSSHGSARSRCDEKK